MTRNNHDHRGEYAGADHVHYAYDISGAAGEHHRHYDLESEITGLREDLNRAGERIHELEEYYAALRAEMHDGRA